MDAVEGEHDHDDEVGDEQRRVEGVPVVEAFEGLVDVMGLEIVTEALGSEEQAEQGYRCMGEEGQVFAPARLAIQSILRDRMRMVWGWAIGEAFVYLSEPICGSRTTTSVPQRLKPQFHWLSFAARLKPCTLSTT